MLESFAGAVPGQLSNHVPCPRAPVSARFGGNPGLELGGGLTVVRWPIIDDWWRSRASIDRTKIVQGNHYFHFASLHKEFFEPSDTHTICSWKGKARYYTLLVDGKENADAAWLYPDPKPAAEKKAFASRPDRFVEI
jgi:Domain of unknown function (DUF427)